MLLTLTDVPLRTASFSLADRHLLWARARLYADRLTLYGWGLWGRYRRQIPFEIIDDVEHEASCLVLHLDGDRVLRLHMDAASRWHTALETHRDVYEE